MRNPSVYDDQEFYNSLLNQYASLSMNHNATVIKQRHSFSIVCSHRMSDSFVLSEDSGKNLRIEPESDDMIARKSSSSSYLFHYPTPRYAY